MYLQLDYTVFMYSPKESNYKNVLNQSSFLPRRDRFPQTFYFLSCSTKNKKNKFISHLYLLFCTHRILEKKKIKFGKLVIDSLLNQIFSPKLDW